jgi:hypothetical protein
MQSFTLAQLERAIHYWREHYEQARYQGSADGARQERLLTALYGRMLDQHLGAIALDHLTSAEFGALGCLYGVPPP